MSDSPGIKLKIHTTVRWIPFRVERGLLIRADQDESDHYRDRFPRDFKSLEDFISFMENDPTHNDLDGEYLLLPIIDRRTTRA
jgi:hypothetical protein